MKQNIAKERIYEQTTNNMLNISSVSVSMMHFMHFGGYQSSQTDLQKATNDENNIKTEGNEENSRTTQSKDLNLRAAPSAEL